jgi:hypothetical protein
MTVTELIRGKRTPVDELRGQIVLPVRKHKGPARDQHIAEHTKGQKQQDTRSDPSGVGHAVGFFCCGRAQDLVPVAYPNSHQLPILAARMAW